MKKIFILIGLCLAFGVDAKQATSTQMQLSKKLSSSRLIVIRGIVHVLTIRPVMAVAVVNVVHIIGRVGMHLCVIRKMSVIGWSKSIKAVVNYQVRILPRGKNEIFSTVYLQICMLQLFRKIS